MPEHPLLDFGDYTNRYTTLLYPLVSYDVVNVSKTTSLNGISTQETFAYNEHGLLNMAVSVQSDGKQNKKQITYPSDYNCGIYKTMQEKNMLVFPVEERTFVDEKFVNGKLTQYMSQGANIVPSAISYAVYLASGNPTSFSCGNDAADIYPRKDILILRYDEQSNPIHILFNNNENIVYLWSYNYQYPIAEIKNTTYQEVKAAAESIALNLDILSRSKFPDMGKVNALRNILSNTHITTYTYKPLVGITSITDSSGKVTYYEYDSFNRLKETYIIENGGKEILESYEYNYANQ